MKKLMPLFLLIFVSLYAHAICPPQNLQLQGGTAVSGNTACNVTSASRYRLIQVDNKFNPFKGAYDGAEYGGAKHVMWSWHPIHKRVYNFGGDFGMGASAFGQPDMGATFKTNNPTNPQSYQRYGSFETDQYSINPYATGLTPWRLEHPYLPRNLNGIREQRPGRVDQASIVWDSKRQKFWGIYTTIRSQYVYRLADGTPDLWANGDMTSSFQPTGTWSFIPNPNGGAGTWTLETAAKLVPGDATQYIGDTLSTSLASERVAYFEYDAKSDRLFGLGYGGTVFIFNPETKKYEYRTLTLSDGYTYLNTSSSQVAVVGDWLYGVAYVRQPSNKSQLLAFHIPTLLSQPNGSSISTSNAQAFRAIALPFSISDGGVWEKNNDGIANWSEHCGVMKIDSKVAVICSYGGIIDQGVTKLAIYDTATNIIKLGDPAPENIYGTSWVALPDTGEIMFGLAASGPYPNGKLWAYRVRN
jgi:hypothetical protein